MPVGNPAGINCNSYGYKKNSSQHSTDRGRRYSDAELVKFNSVQLYSSALMTPLTVDNAKITHFRHFGAVLSLHCM